MSALAVVLSREALALAFVADLDDAGWPAEYRMGGDEFWSVAAALGTRVEQSNGACWFEVHSNDGARTTLVTVEAQ